MSLLESGGRESIVYNREASERLRQIITSFRGVPQVTHGEIVHLLTTLKADPNITAPGRYDKNYPLTLAASYSMRGAKRQELAEIESIICAFVDRDEFDVNYMSGGGRALIHYAAKLESTYLLGYMLNRKNGAKVDVNIFTPGSIITGGRSGYTALHLACTSSSAMRDEKVRLLLQHGADPNAARYDGLAPMHFLVTDHAYFHPIGCIRVLLEEGGADPNLRVENGILTGYTPMHLAIFNRCPLSILALLLKNGADLSIPDSFNQTPVQLARELGRTEIVNFFMGPTISRALLHHGLNLELRDKIKDYVL